MKKYLPIIIVSGVVVVGFGYYTVFSTPAYKNIDTLEKSQNELSENLDQEVLTKAPLSGIDTLQNIAGFGQNVECSIQFDSEAHGSTIEGTYFVAGEDIRGDFITPTPDLSGVMVSSLIIKDGVYYIWSEIDGEKYGAKMNVSDLETEEARDRQTVSMNESVNYDCKVWENIDNTIFLAPEDVLFYDMNETFESGMEYGTIYEEGEF